MTGTEFMSEVYKMTSGLEQAGVEITPELQKGIEKYLGLQNYINIHNAESILTDMQLKAMKEQIEAAIISALKKK